MLIQVLAEAAVTQTAVKLDSFLAHAATFLALVCADKFLAVMSLSCSISLHAYRKHLQLHSAVQQFNLQ
jgi:hypothetical protein